MNNKLFMSKAIALSLKMMQKNQGGPFGAIIVKNGEIISKGWNKVTSSNDPTAHGEIVAIRNACKKLKSFNLSDCTIYTSCEPCPMCLSALYWAKINTIYYANTKIDAESIGFSDNFIYLELAKPMNKKSIDFIQIMHPEALEVFKQWKMKQDKITY